MEQALNLPALTSSVSSHTSLNYTRLEDHQTPAHQKVSFKRCVLPTPHPNWSTSTSQIPADLLTPWPSHSLQPEPGCNVEVSFANKDVGFGVSGTQEEAKMGMSPEACVVMLLAPSLHDNKTLLIRGARQIGLYKGIGRELRYTGLYSGERDWSLRCIVAMDAMELDTVGDDSCIQELKEDVSLRELNKAYCGFYSVADERVSIATGHWGCGAFGGNKYVKSLIQVMAACQADKQLVFHDIIPRSHDPSEGMFVQSLLSVVERLSQTNTTVGKLFTAIVKIKQLHNGSNLFDEIGKLFSETSVAESIAQ